MRNFTHKSNFPGLLSRTILFLAFSVTFLFGANAQTTIWSEDFSSYTNGSGVDGTGNIGDYPGSVVKWSLDVSSCILSDDKDYVKIRDKNRYLYFRDVDGDAKWNSESISLVGYTNVQISLNVSGSSGMESDDFMRCQYRINGSGAWVNFFERYDYFGTTTAAVIGLSGNNLEIRVVANNDDNNDNHYIDNIVVSGHLSNVVHLSSGASSLPEGGGSTSIVATLNGVQPDDVTVYLLFSGSASASDYNKSGTQIFIPAGSLSGSISLSSVNDTNVEGDEIITVDIASVVNGVEDGVQQLNVTIVDDDFPSTASIEVDDKAPENTYSPNSLVQNVLVTGCLTASNVAYSGDQTRGIGYFNKGASDFPLSSGIILSTGDVNSAEGPNNVGNRSNDIGDASGDSDVNAITSGTAYDAQVLEFDFVPAGDQLEFRYVFASEEYPEYACTAYNDAFAFIISGHGITGPYSNNGANIALIPGTSNPVTINNVNNQGCGNSTYYVDGAGGYATQFDGRTTVLTAKATVEPCQTYHIRLIIADVADAQFNSAVFLEAESFKTNEVVIQNGLGGSGDLEVMYEGCDNSFLKFTREDNIDEDYTFDITISGTAENGIDFVQTTSGGAELGAFPEQITIPANETEVTYYYKAISDALIEGDEYFRISFLKTCPCSPTPDYYTKEITIIDVPEIEASVPSNVQCEMGTPVATITVELKDGLNPTNYQYSLDGGAYQDDNVFTINNPVVGSEHSVSVQDKFSCNSPVDFSVTIPVVVPIAANAGSDKSMCEGQTVQLSGSGGIYYEWSCMPSSGVNYLSNVNASNPTVDTDIPYGVYTYTLTVKESSSASAYCVSTDDMVLTVKENSSFTVAADKTEYCSGEQIQLSSVISNSALGDSYLWTPSSGINNPTAANTTAMYSTTIVSVKDFSLEVTKSNGCSNTKTISGIVIYPHPVVSLNTSSNRCSNGSDGQLNVNVTGGTPFATIPFYNYSWSHDGALNSPDATGLNVGNYTVIVSDSKGCSKAESYSVEANPNPAGIYHE